MPTTGEKPGKGTYACTCNGHTLHLDSGNDQLPPCPKCHCTTYRRVS